MEKAKILFLVLFASLSSYAHGAEIQNSLHNTAYKK
jgi:hypothetical protein